MLVDLHVAQEGAVAPVAPSPQGGLQGPSRRCSALNVDAVQPVLAARWAASVVSSQAHQVAVGKEDEDDEDGPCVYLYLPSPD